MCPSIPELEQVGDLELHEHGCPLRGKTSPAGSCRSSCKDPVSKFCVIMISKSVANCVEIVAVIIKCGNIAAVKTVCT